MAPVAGGVADRDEQRHVPLAGARERLRAPRQPVDGVLGVLAQVRRGLLRERVRHALSVAANRRRRAAAPGCTSAGRSAPSDGHAGGPRRRESRARRSLMLEVPPAERAGHALGARADPRRSARGAGARDADACAVCSSPWRTGKRARQLHARDEREVAAASPPRRSASRSRRAARRSSRPLGSCWSAWSVAAITCRLRSTIVSSTAVSVRPGLPPSPAGGRTSASFARRDRRRGENVVACAVHGWTGVAREERRHRPGRRSR